MWHILQQLFIFGSIDKLIDNAFLYTLIIQELSHVHAPIHFVSVIVIHNIIHDIRQCRSSVLIILIIMIEIDCRWYIAVILHHCQSAQNHTIIFSDIVNSHSILLPCSLLHFFPYQCCKTWKFHKLFILLLIFYYITCITSFTAIFVCLNNETIQYPHSFETTQKKTMKRILP